jgi:hypothetical protein
MASRPVTIAGVIHCPKNAAKEAVRALVARNLEDGKPFTGADVEMAEALLAMHPRAKCKLRRGKRGIAICTAAGRGRGIGPAPEWCREQLTPGQAGCCRLVAVPAAAVDQRPHVDPVFQIRSGTCDSDQELAMLIGTGTPSRLTLKDS